MNIEDIYAYVLQNGPYAEGEVFIATMPSVGSGLMLREPLTGIHIDHSLPGYFRTNFQVIVREPEYQAGRQNALAVMDLLTFQQERTIGSMQVKQCLPRTMPHSYPRSDGNGIEWSMTFDIACARI